MLLKLVTFAIVTYTISPYKLTEQVMFIVVVHFDDNKDTSKLTTSPITSSDISVLRKENCFDKSLLK